jgi:ATP-dependent DNA ligase
MSPPKWIKPQLCKLAAKAPSGPLWVHEIKFDGYRIAARIDQGAVQLLTRSGLDWTAKYPGPPPRSGRLGSNPPILTASSAAFAQTA